MPRQFPVTEALEWRRLLSARLTLDPTWGGDGFVTAPETEFAADALPFARLIEFIDRRIVDRGKCPRFDTAADHTREMHAEKRERWIGHRIHEMANQRPSLRPQLEVLSAKRYDANVDPFAGEYARWYSSPSAFKASTRRVGRWP